MRFHLISLAFAVTTLPAGSGVAPGAGFGAPHRCRAVSLTDTTNGDWEVFESTEHIKATNQHNIVATLQNASERRIRRQILTDWGPETGVTDLSISRDGRRLAYAVEACGELGSGCDYSAYLSTDGRGPKRLRGLYWEHSGFSSDGKTLWMKTERGFLALDVASQKIKWRWRVRVPSGGPSNWATVLNGEAERFVVISEDNGGKARFSTYDFRTRTVKSQILDPTMRDSELSPRGLWHCNRGPLKSRKLQPNQTSLWMHNTRTDHIWSATLTLQNPQFYDLCRQVTFSPDETLCAVHNGPRVEIFQTATGCLLRQLPAAPGKWWAAKFSTNNSKFWTATKTDFWVQRAS